MRCLQRPPLTARQFRVSWQAGSADAIPRALRRADLLTSMLPKYRELLTTDLRMLVFSGKPALGLAAPPALQRQMPAGHASPGAAALGGAARWPAGVTACVLECCC